MRKNSVWASFALWSLLVSTLALGIASAGLAEGPKPFPDFSAKRVTPPKPGQSKRITVQIAPKDPLAVQTPEAGPPQSKGQKAPAVVAWFWEDVSPDLDASGPGRLEPALQSLSNPPQGEAVPAPRLATLQGIVQAHGTDILIATIGKQVSPALVLAVIAVESGGRVEAQSGAGAQGLMQLMPATAARFGVVDSFDGAANIAGGALFLDFLMQKFEGDPILVLAGYNAGENAIAEHSGVPPYAETRAYVPKVLAAFQVARALCMTPPELITDGCVFAKP
ncbi:lytic transglycosylase domain-containing protein [Shimia marina]|uniref:Soluble lytic murein transglycosylase n=1 Tax=Shimia marina TaxID=321267 RepID=A0A0P1EPG7_9RHOB|nr:lytic transglycosylase domain-containing protein [Shimia marina]CUH52275.1 Soluble lytic murein transglycosylase precursor [Shimia marina]SFE07406.1 Soluble lytic murein transglycosylase [Shimia marina]